MARKINKLWVEKYKPTTLDQYIFHSKIHEDKFRKIVADRDLPNILLSGGPGSGKSTLSNVLVAELGIDEADILRINASDENSVDDMREKINSFASTFAIGGSFKIVQMEEADYLSQNAQAILRGIIEDNSDNCRFIFTCNYDNKILPAIKSRLQQFFFKTPSMEETQVRMAEILIAEGAEFELDSLERFVAASYPDIRKIINTLQQCYRGEGVQIVYSSVAGTSDVAQQVVDLISTGDFTNLRKFVVSSVSKEEFDGLYQVMYQSLNLAPQFKKDKDKYESALVLVNSYLYKHALVAIPELNFEALCIELGQI